jgi:hypothetical protein
MAIVADTCFQTKFKQLAKTSSNDAAFAFQRNYWAQVGLQTHRRYALSLASDPDLSITVAISGFVLLNVTRNQTFTFCES